jgi:hypothetical protein
MVLEPSASCLLKEVIAHIFGSKNSRPRSGNLVTRGENSRLWLASSLGRLAGCQAPSAAELPRQIASHTICTEKMPCLGRRSHQFRFSILMLQDRGPPEHAELLDDGTCS